MWMSNIMKMYGCKTHIYSLDIDLSLVGDLAKADEHISFIECDAAKIEDAFPEKLLKVSKHISFAVSNMFPVKQSIKYENN